MKTEDLKFEERFKKAYEENFNVQVPQDGTEMLTPETKVLQKRRRMAKVKNELASTKVKFDVKMDYIAYKGNEISKKEAHLKQSLFKFDKYLLEHTEKRNKALKKASEEREGRLQKEKEVSKLMVEIEQLRKESERYEEKLERNQVFHNYMMKTVDRSDGFHEVRDIMGRYDTLVSTQIHLIHKDETNQDAIATDRAKLAKYTEDKEDEILQCSNQIAQLQLRLDDAQSKAAEWENKYSYLQEKADEKRLLLGRLKVAINNLFMLMNKNVRHLQPNNENPVHLEHQDTQSKLNHIHVFIKDLNKMIQDHKTKPDHKRPDQSEANK